MDGDSTNGNFKEVAKTDTLDLLLLTDREIVLTIRNVKDQSFLINRDANILIHFVKDITIKK